MFMQTINHSNRLPVTPALCGRADHPFKTIFEAPEPATRMICFSGAGTSASFFSFWRNFGGTQTRVDAYQPKGRDGRWSEGAASLDASAEEAAQSLAAQTQGATAERLVLFGHSYGALLAYEVAQRLRRADVQVSHLIVAARAAPHMAPHAQHAADLPDADLIAALRGLGLDDKQVLDHPVLGPLCMNNLRHDLAENASYIDWHAAALSCPITALSGTYDPLAPPLAMANWQTATTGAFFHHRLNGSHFFPASMPHRVARLIKARLGAV